MLLCRRFDEEIVTRYSKQQIRCPVHLSLGQEAIAVGVCHHFTQRRFCVSLRIETMPITLRREGILRNLLWNYTVRLAGVIMAEAASMHAIDTAVNFMSGPIVASAIPLAVGTAMANKINKNGNICRMLLWRCCCGGGCIPRIS